MSSSPAVAKARGARSATVAAAAAVRHPELLAPDEVLVLFREFDTIRRSAEAANLLLAKQLEDTGEARRQGKASTADLLAEMGGTSVGAARAALDASKALSDLPETRDALLSGAVSPEQGKVIAGAARQNPNAERRLLKQATTGSHQELRAAAQRARAEADPNPEARHRRIHTGRNLSMWVDDEGVWHLHAKGTVTDGARIQKAIERETDRIFRANASATHHEPRGAYAFDALRGLTTRPATTPGTSGRQPAPEHLALLRLDLSALKRGKVTDGELCEIAGIGPIPVAVAKALLGDAVLKLVITDGVDVLNVTSITRGPTQAMKYADLWSSPACTVAGCDRTICEYDHTTGAEFKDTRHTRLDEIDRVCTVHHDLHTRLGWALVKGTGKRPMVPPGHPDHPTRPGEPGDPPLNPMTDEEVAQLLENIRICKATFHKRVDGREPPDPTRGPAPPEVAEPVGASPSLFG